MEIAARMHALREVYNVYDAFCSDLTVACQRGCAACCTQNVTITTLEGYEILRHLVSNGKTELLERVRDTAHIRRLQPAVSTNELADLCMKGETLPEEDEEYTQMACPFLSDSECLIYEERPFGCRCFFSKRVCKPGTSAEAEPFLITVNTVFLQLIEHIDKEGLFGNMTDVLLFLERENQRKDNGTESPVNHTKGLARNRKISALLMPPEHQLRLQPILDQVTKIIFKPAALQ